MKMRKNHKGFRSFIFAVLTTILFSLTMMPLYGVAATWYVAPADAGGDDSNPGTGWGAGEPFATIQRGVLFASSNANDVVLVSNGTYVFSSEVQITAGITVRSLEGRSKTFINCNYPDSQNRGFYLRHTDALLEGFTISNAYINDGGGAVRVEKGLVRDCRMTRSWGNRGSGVYIESDGIVSNCLIDLNDQEPLAGYGGGVENVGGLITDSQIISNKSRSYGGGIYLRDGGTISNSLITDNKSTNSYGGGIATRGIVNVYNCQIVSNEAPVQRGGGICFQHGPGGVVADSLIAGNSSGLYGGGIILEGTEVYNCQVINNTATDHGGGISTAIAGSINYVRNCLIAGNVSLSSSYGGGGMHVGMGTVAFVENCTIVSNSAPNKRAGGIYVYRGGLNIGNSIITSNTASETTYLEWIGTSGTNAFTNCLMYSLTQTVVLPGVSNITDKPAGFVQASDGNYRLSSDSPCVNAGRNQPEWMENARDLDGRLRLDPFTRQVDIGCYEYLSSGSFFYLR